MLKLLVICAFSVLTVHAGLFEPPQWIGLCSRNENINECLKDAIQAALPHLARGSRKFGAVPLDPFFIKESDFKYKENGFNIQMKIFKMNVVGFTEAAVTGVRTKFNDNKFSLDIDFHSPAIYIDYDYKISGQFETIPISGKGYSNCSMHDLTYTLKLRGVKETHDDGQQYIKIIGFQMRPEVGDMKVYLSNLYVANQEISQLVTSLSNQYWPIIYSALLPYVEPYWNEYGISEANSIFQKISVDRLFAPTPVS